MASIVAASVIAVVSTIIATSVVVAIPVVEEARAVVWGAPPDEAGAVVWGVPESGVQEEAHKDGVVGNGDGVGVTRFAVVVASSIAQGVRKLFASLGVGPGLFESKDQAIAFVLVTGCVVVVEIAVDMKQARFLFAVDTQWFFHECRGVGIGAGLFEGREVDRIDFVLKLFHPCFVVFWVVCLGFPERVFDGFEIDFGIPDFDGLEVHLGGGLLCSCSLGDVPASASGRLSGEQAPNPSHDKQEEDDANDDAPGKPWFFFVIIFFDVLIVIAAWSPSTSSSRHISSPCENGRDDCHLCVLLERISFFSRMTTPLQVFPP